MKCKYGKAIQWRDGDSLLTGVLVLTADGQYVTADFGVIPDGKHERVLVAHSHTRELEFVPWDSLSPYPSEPIPTP